jgi:hypothetical protein
MLQFILMGAQAAGMIGSVMGESSRVKLAKIGQELDEQQANLRLQQDRIAANEQGLMQLEQLREVLASQRALVAARGGMPGMGSALALEQKSIANFQKDEQARERSLLFASQQQQARTALGRIGVVATQAQAGANMFKGAFSLIPFTEFTSALSGTQAPAPVTTATPTSTRGGLLTGSGSSAG